MIAIELRCDSRIYHLDLQHRVTHIVGNSGTGKTTMYDDLIQFDTNSEIAKDKYSLQAPDGFILKPIESGALDILLQLENVSEMAKQLFHIPEGYKPVYVVDEDILAGDINRFKKWVQASNDMFIISSRSFINVEPTPMDSIVTLQSIRSGEEYHYYLNRLYDKDDVQNFIKSSLNLKDTTHLFS